LGFLPGDIRAKVDPYLRPLYDALQDMLAFDKVKKLMELGVIEIAPLAFMRGRTLNSAFVILDEAQNTTSAQMMMFLTRLGEGSKAVITGDITQIDLENRHASGLLPIQKILGHIKGIGFIYLTEKDVVRHRLVQEIIKAYEKVPQAQKRPAARRK
jgi:phosphate starvation-inducible PhoH-like protein